MTELDMYDIRNGYTIFDEDGYSLRIYGSLLDRTADIDVLKKIFFRLKYNYPKTISGYKIRVLIYVNYTDTFAPPNGIRITIHVSLQNGNSKETFSISEVLYDIPTNSWDREWWETRLREDIRGIIGHAIEWSNTEIEKMTEGYKQ